MLEDQVIAGAASEADIILLKQLKKEVEDELEKKQGCVLSQLNVTIRYICQFVNRNKYL